MQRGNALAVFLVVLAGAAAFVWWSSGELPARVASHFGASGVANGYMPHEVYARLMLALVVGMPALLVILPAASIGSPNARINLPNREYWLAPERRAETVATLRRYMTWTATMLALFLAYAHWQVVRANRLDPPTLPTAPFVTAVMVFLLAMIVMTMTMLRHFRQVPR